MDVSFKTRKRCSTITLPPELILWCILPKLPAKSLIRFKCVSKSFLTEISSRKFASLFSETNHRLLILPSSNRKFGIYELDSLKSPPTLCPYPIPSQWYAPFTSMMASSESFLLIGCGFTELEGLILFNPTTRIYRVLPKIFVPTVTDYVDYGMCHCFDDELNADFKIVRFVRALGMREVALYSMRSDSWRRIERKKEKTELIGEPVLVQNHLLVMLCFREGRLIIGCFDVKAERWSNDVLLSDIILAEIDTKPTRYGDDPYGLGVVDGRLHFSGYEVNKSSYSVWVMKDYGVKSSWFKLMSLSGQGIERVYLPLAYRKGSSHELLCVPDDCNWGKCFWYNIRDKQLIETGIDGDELNTTDFSFAYVCKQSLLNIPGGLLIRSSPNLPEVDDDNDEDYYSHGYYDDGFVYSEGKWL